MTRHKRRCLNKLAGRRSGSTGLLYSSCRGRMEKAKGTGCREGENQIVWDSFNWKLNPGSFIIYFLWNCRMKKKRFQWNMVLPACSRIPQKPLFSFPWSQGKHVFSGSIFSSLKQKLTLLCVPTVPTAIGLLSQQGLLSATVIKLINHIFNELLSVFCIILDKECMQTEKAQKFNLEHGEGNFNL